MLFTNLRDNWKCCICFSLIMEDEDSKFLLDCTPFGYCYNHEKKRDADTYWNMIYDNYGGCSFYGIGLFSKNTNYTHHNNFKKKNKWCPLIFPCTCIDCGYNCIDTFFKLSTNGTVKPSSPMCDIFCGGLYYNIFFCFSICNNSLNYLCSKKNNNTVNNNSENENGRNGLNDKNPTAPIQIIQKNDNKKTQIVEAQLVEE